MLKLVPLDPKLPAFLGPYLRGAHWSTPELPYILVTYAQLVDSRISILPGVQTKISSLQTKTMTHYIRSRFEGILVGIGTFLADDPSLNCRYLDSKSPGRGIRPIIVDPRFKSCTLLETLTVVCKVKDGTGLKPIVIIDESLKSKTDETIKQFVDFLYLPLEAQLNRFDWKTLFTLLKAQFGLQSIMVEGGAVTINELLKKDPKPLVDALIITIGPVFLGQNGVQVSPVADLQLKDVKWWSCSEGDAVIAARLAEQ